MAASQTNTSNPATIVIYSKPKPGVYTREDFTRDLQKITKAAAGRRSTGKDSQ